jgi:allophanate hydrolase subunit 2
MSRLTIEASTPLCLLQDAGRFGVRHLGVTQGGGLDWCSMSWANWLLGNRLDAGDRNHPRRVCRGGEDDCVLALAGADLGAQVDGEALAPWRSFKLHKGQRLQFTQPLLGARAYLAAPGGLMRRRCWAAAPRWCAKNSVAWMVWGCRWPRARLGYSVRCCVKLPGHRPDLRLNAAGPGARRADRPVQRAESVRCVQHPWTLDSRADRMGIRLLGTALQYQGRPMISEGIPLGAVQVPPDGQPIVLLNDRQTIGGYPRLGALTPLALARLAQCSPGRRCGWAGGATSRTASMSSICSAFEDQAASLRQLLQGNAIFVERACAKACDGNYLDRNRIPSSSPRKVSGYICPRSTPARYWSRRCSPRCPSDTG